jgi:F-type H+-transporting ATPase subunit b
VASTLQQASEQLKRHSDAIESELRSSVQTLSATLASRVLGVEVTGARSAATSASRR